MEEIVEHFENQNAREGTPKISQIIFTPDLHTNVHFLNLANLEIKEFVFSSILARVPALKMLELINVILIKTDNQISRIFYKEMDSLVFENSDAQLLEYFLPISLNRLRIASCDMYLHESLKNFLLQINNLNCLELLSIGCDITNFFTTTNFSFHLRQLILSSTVGNRNDTYANENGVIDFLNQQSQSIKELEILAPLPDNVMEFALKKLRLLKSLKLKLNLLPVEENFYFKKNPKKSVKKLILEGQHIDEMQVENILKLYSAVQSLHLNNNNVEITSEITAGILKAASKHCTVLYELSMTRLPLMGHLKFKSLSILKLKYINSITELASMLECSPKLKSLYIDHIFRGQCDKELVDVLLSFKLRDLHINAEPLECKKIFKLIENNPLRKLDILELEARSIDFVKVYQFRFKTINGIASNYNELFEKMDEDVTCYIMQDFVRLFISKEIEDLDSAIIEHVLNTFDLYANYNHT